MGYSKKKIEAQKGQSMGAAVQAVKESPFLIKGIPTPKILDGKIVNVNDYIQDVLKVIREYLLLRYNLGSDVHEPWVAIFVDALQRWHLARDALEQHGDYQLISNGSFVQHPAHHVKLHAAKVINQFAMDFGLLPRQAFTRAEASSAGGTESHETDVWTHMAGALKNSKQTVVIQ